MPPSEVYNSKRNAGTLSYILDQVEESITHRKREKKRQSYSFLDCRFANWGERLPHRPSEDIAFAIARFFQRGGSLQNYYMVFRYL